MQFHGTFEQNLRKLKNLKFPDADEWIEKLRLDEKRPRDVPSLPVLVTAASPSFFDVSQGVIKTVHEKLLPKYPDLKMIYYGLGLSGDQKLKVPRITCLLILAYLS